MKKTIWGLLFTVTAFIAGVMIYEDLTLDRGICGGGARGSSTLVFGNPPGPQYGIERESYWTDPAGEVIIPYLDPSRIPLGCKHHISASLLVGGLSFPLPLRPWVDATLSVFAVAAMGWFFAIYRARPHTQVHEASIES